MKLGCVIMAAGSASRFGANKLLADFMGKPLYLWTLDAAAGSSFFRTVVVTGYEPICMAARERGFLAVENRQPEQGVSCTIGLGLAALPECDGVLFLTADQPLLTAKTLDALRVAFLENPQQIIAASHEGKRGNPCLFPKDLFPALLALEGDTGGSRVIRENAHRVTLVEVRPEELWDCDTPQALQLLESAKICEKTCKNP